MRASVVQGRELLLPERPLQGLPGGLLGGQTMFTVLRKGHSLRLPTLLTFGSARQESGVAGATSNPEQAEPLGWPRVLTSEDLAGQRKLLAS